MWLVASLLQLSIFFLFSMLQLFVMPLWHSESLVYLNDSFSRLGNFLLKLSWICFLPFFFFFCVTGVWIQGFMLARQAFYHLSHTSSPWICFLCC
jgi:hypothetical protein